MTSNVVSFSRCTCIRVFVQTVRKLAPKARGAFHFASPDNEGSGAPNGAPCPLPGTAGETAPVTGYSRGPHDKGRSPFGAPLRIDGSCLPTRPGPALPGITGSKREVCTPSPAPVQRAPRSLDTR